MHGNVHPAGGFVEQVNAASDPPRPSRIAISSKSLQARIQVAGQTEAHGQVPLSLEQRFGPLAL